MILYLVLQYREPTFEIQGIFSTKSLALKACVNESCLITEHTLDEQLPEETTPPKKAWYPHLEAEPNQEEIQCK